MNDEMDFKALLADARKSAEYAEEAALLEFTEEMVRRMDADKVSRAELARRLGCTPPYITKLLRGPRNFTLASMARIAQALGCTLRVRMQPGGTASRLATSAEAPAVKHQGTAGAARPNRCALPRRRRTQLRRERRDEELLAELVGAEGLEPTTR